MLNVTMTVSDRQGGTDATSGDISTLRMCRVEAPSTPARPDRSGDAEDRARVST